MPSVFDSQFAASAFPGLLDTFGESITYWPGTGSFRTIVGIIDRDPPELIDGSGNAIKPKATIQVTNSTTLGISSRELDTGRDEISFMLKIGDTIATRLSVNVLQASGGGVTSLVVL